MSDDIKVTDKRGQTKDEPKLQEPKTQKTSGQENDIGFANLVISLGTSAMVHMGIIENPHTKQKEKNLEMAKQEIDLIEMLNKKTKGNLTEAETKVIEQVLYELRLRFVEASK